MLTHKSRWRCAKKSRKYLIVVGGLDIVDVLCFYVSIVGTVLVCASYLSTGMEYGPCAGFLCCLLRFERVI